MSNRDAGIGKGGETHQVASGGSDVMTTNHGVPVSDNQNSLKSGARGPTLLEDFVLRERSSTSTTSAFQSEMSSPRLRRAWRVRGDGRHLRPIQGSGV